ncbi:MAG: sensor histidine kinase [Candidatus Dormibacteria bacterium]
MISRLRRSFAAKLVALEIGTILIVALVLAGALIAIRTIQTRDLERNIAIGSVGALRRDLSDAGTGAVAFTARLAAFAPLQTALGQGDRATLAAFLDQEAATLTSSDTLVLLDRTGGALLARRGGGVGAAGLNPTTYSHSPAIEAFGGPTLPTSGALLRGPTGSLELDGLTPVLNGTSTVGFVLDSMDVAALLQRASGAGSEVHYSVFYNGTRLASTLEPSLVGGALPGAIGVGSEQVNSFATYTLGGHRYAGYYGAFNQDPAVLLAADVDEAVFAAQTQDELLSTLSAVALLATVLTLLALAFARRFAIRPLRALGRGAERLGAGDYSAHVEVGSRDDFGRLGEAFNSMAERIRASSAEVEEQRARLDASLRSLGAVSSALTATTAGADALRQAVLDAVSDITGAEAVVIYSGVDRPRAEAAIGVRIGAGSTLGRVDAVASAVATGGGSGRVSDGPAGFERCHFVAVPMMYQERAVGILAGYSPRSLASIDIPALTVLANQATVALENTALFEQQKETVRRLQELDAMKSDFLATIQHELRTPLTAIIGMTDLMEMCWDTWADRNKIEALGDVQLAAKGLYDLVETILDYSMLESDRMRLSISPCSLADAVNMAVDDLGDVARRAGAEVRVDVAAGARVEADMRRLVQVVRALVDNGIKFSGDSPRVRVSTVREADRVGLVVRDRGVGIAAADQGRIFERFYQVDNTATRRYGGTGMGLALVQRLVAMMKGSVVVQSEPGKGAQFTVWFPSAPPAPRAVVSKAAAMPRAPRSTPSNGAVRPRARAKVK